MSAVSLAGPPLPTGLVQSSPAASPQAVQAAMATAGLAPAAGLAAAPTVAGAAPDGKPAAFDVPREFLDKLEAAVSEGTKDALTFAAEHTPAERWMVANWALLRMVWPPKDDAEDLAYLHGVAKTRTPAGVDAARYWSKHGLTDEWEAMLKQYTAKAGPAQARAATKLLHDALAMVNSVTQTAKAGAARKRPFVVDPSLPLAVDKPGNNPSYPSGHTSAAYAACMVLAHLMPDRAAEFMGIARDASWARVYAGVHFPTDVLAGAKLATTVTSYLIRTSQAQPIKGTVDPSVNPGVAGGRRALDGAAVLAGTPIAAAGASPAAPVMAPGQPGT
ncbi:MAG: phosphatase family protein [Thermoleophilia bacterium]|nr:phosphatase family protein [Thermoleophilia bacterium]